MHGGKPRMRVNESTGCRGGEEETRGEQRCTTRSLFSSSGPLDLSNLCFHDCCLVANCGCVRSESCAGPTEARSNFDARANRADVEAAGPRKRVAICTGEEHAAQEGKERPERSDGTSDDNEQIHSSSAGAARRLEDAEPDTLVDLAASAASRSRIRARRAR